MPEPVPTRRAVRIRWIPDMGRAAIAAALGVWLAGCGGKEAEMVTVTPKTVCVNAEGLALDGFDPVSYFEPGGPKPGDPALTHRWNDATWRFATDAHRKQFMKDPAKYAPAYGGACAFAVSIGKHLTGVHGQWTVRDGRLYLNNNLVAKWLFRMSGKAVAKADANWMKGTLKK